VASTGLANDKNVNPTISLTGDRQYSCSAVGEVVYRRVAINDENVADTSIDIHSSQGTELKEFEDFLFYKID